MSLTDVHVHLAALPTPENGCLMSRRMRRSLTFRLAARGQGLPLGDPEAANRLYLERLQAELERSRRVGRAVLLAMDGVYDLSGALDERGTHFLVSNDAVFAAAARAPGLLLPGVSINPCRKDALEELRRCAARGAVLVKFLANVQGFDPGAPRCRPFYRAMARLRLPLLAHAGFEFSLASRDQAAGGLGRLRLALEEGVAVIAAHGGSSGLPLWDREWPEALRLLAAYPSFYLDVSALTLPNRVGALLRLGRHPELSGRLFFGTDYPLPVFSLPALAAGSWRRYRDASAADNRFDRQALVLDAWGVRPEADLARLYPAG